VAEERESALKEYTSRGALVYYALVLPALVAEVVFSVAVASSPGDLLAPGGVGGGLATTTVQLLPWFLLLASVYAVFAFRSSLLVSFLIVSFFIAASVAGTISFAGAPLDLGDAVLLVVAATFLALAGFNYARGVKLLGRRKADVTTSGPLGYNLIGLAADSAVPLVAALALVGLVETVVGALGAQAARLPPPLSSLATLYLQTRVGTVFTTLFVAGAAIWVMRQFLEPIILHFTLTPADARRELLAEIEPTLKSVRKVRAYKPSGGLAWGVIGVAYCVGLFTALAFFVPRAEFAKDLVAALTLHPTPPTQLEVLMETTLQNGLVKIDILYAQSQDFIRTVVRILWG